MSHTYKLKWGFIPKPIGNKRNSSSFIYTLKPLNFINVGQTPLSYSNNKYKINKDLAEAHFSPLFVEFSICKFAYRDKIVYIRIFLHPAKAGLILGVVLLLSSLFDNSKRIGQRKRFFFSSIFVSCPALTRKGGGDLYTIVWVNQY